MFSRSRKSLSPFKGKASRVEAPFEKRRREIAELESKLKNEEARAKHFIDTAPKIAQERQKKQREAFLSNATSPGMRDGFRLPDSRYGTLEANAAALPRTRRRDQRRGKWVFFMLVLTLLAAAWWAWQTLFQTAF